MKVILLYFFMSALCFEGGHGSPETMFQGSQLTGTKDCLGAPNLLEQRKNGQGKSYGYTARNDCVASIVTSCCSSTDVLLYFSRSAFSLFGEHGSTETVSRCSRSA